MSLKVLFISNFRSYSGYGRASIDDMLALDKAGFDVVAREARMSNDIDKVPLKIEEFVSKSAEKPDIVIQRNIPAAWSKNSSALNIGCFAWETPVLPSSWINYINSVDHIVMPTEYQKKILEVSGIQSSISVIPHAVEIPSIKDKANFPVDDSCYKFYTIADNNTRKNLQRLIEIYFLSFTKNNNVCLLIKSNGSSDIIGKSINDLKQKMNLYSSPEYYPTVLVLTEKLTNDEIQKIHNWGDCFVSTTYGEGFMYPAFDAAITGNHIILPNHIDFYGFKDVVQYAPSYHVPIVDGGPLYKRFWQDVDAFHMCDLMQKAFKGNRKKGLPRMDMAMYFSYENIGNKWKDAIETL
jgi:hypothetical protein